MKPGFSGCHYTQELYASMFSYFFYLKLFENSYILDGKYFKKITMKQNNCGIQYSHYLLISDNLYVYLDNYLYYHNLYTQTKYLYSLKIY